MPTVLLVPGAPAQAATGVTNGRIAFSTDPSSNPQIFTVNPNGSGETQISNSSQGHAFAPEWSADGTKIAFEGDRTGNLRYERRRKQPDGDHPGARGTTTRGSRPTAPSRLVSFPAGDPAPGVCDLRDLGSAGERNTPGERRMITARRRCHETTPTVHRGRDD